MNISAKASGVTKEAWLYNENAFYIGFDYIHCFCFNFCSLIRFFESPRPSLAKEGSTFSPSPSSSGSGDVTALRCSEPLRSKVGGPSKVYARFCGMGPPGVGCLQLPILIQINIDIEWSITILYHFHQLIQFLS